MDRAYLAVALGIPAPVLFFWGMWLLATSRHRSERERAGHGLAAVAMLLACIASVLLGAWPLAVVNGLGALLAAWEWWKRRRRKDRAPRAYGEKSRALVAALVRRAREAARPRPVLRPIPGAVS
jgi:hypothetical protein